MEGQHDPYSDQLASMDQIRDIIAGGVQADFDGQQAAGSARTAHRDVHVKMHGLLRAEFIVEPSLPEELKVGVFAESKTFPCWIRFSNGNPKVQSDRLPDGHGMAIKLLDVPGTKILAGAEDATTQDFVLADHPVFFIRNVADYLKFLQCQEQHPLPATLFWYGITGLSHAREALIAFQSVKHLANPLAAQYWSQTPYRFGNRAVKYSVVPRGLREHPSIDPTGENHLREAISEHLKSDVAWFDFLVQFSADDQSTPIEDATIEWSTPFVHVASIRIQDQDFNNQDRDRLGENLSFNPWHSLPEHAPLGAINYTRRVVYEAIADLRRGLNGVSKSEPGPGDGTP